MLHEGMHDMPIQEGIQGGASGWHSMIAGGWCTGEGDLAQ